MLSFRLLKYIYSREIELYIKLYINYSIKTEFQIVFRSVFNKVIIQQNVLSRFRRLELILYNLDIVISKLDIRLHTPIPLLLLLIPTTV